MRNIKGIISVVIISSLIISTTLPAAEMLSPMGNREIQEISSERNADGAKQKEGDVFSEDLIFRLSESTYHVIASLLISAVLSGFMLSMFILGKEELQSEIAQSRYLLIFLHDFLIIPGTLGILYFVNCIFIAILGIQKLLVYSFLDKDIGLSNIGVEKMWNATVLSTRYLLIPFALFYKVKYIQQDYQINLDNPFSLFESQEFALIIARIAIVTISALVSGWTFKYFSNLWIFLEKIKPPAVSPQHRDIVNHDGTACERSS